MVVADQGNWVADVVIVVEGTANLSPYVESLKSHYIVPTLEYFNGGQIDDRDCGYDSNSTTYALVVFMASDCAPEPAAICHAPTTNVAKLLSWFDRVSFVGGAGESCSHIAEGLGTALQVFDDFQGLREPGAVVQKHCILVCNSPPYRLPTLESPVYAGHSVEQLAAIMAERQVNFSILSPRKIPALYKLYEKAGGDLQTALCKNYAKDRRHMVLLRGYQLQERPVSPPIAVSEVKVEPTPSPSAVVPHNPRSPATTPAGVGQKRPAGGSPPNPREAKMFKQPTSQASPISTMGGSPQQPQLSFQNQGARPGIPTPPAPHLAAINQPNPPNVTLRPMPDTMNRTTQNRSPVTIGGAGGTVRLPWSQQPPQGVVSPVVSGGPPVSTPPPPTQTSMPLLASQLSNAPMASVPPQQMRPTHPTPVSCAPGPQMQTGFRGPSMRMGVPPGGGPPGVVGQGGNPLVGAGAQVSQQGMPPTGPAAPPPQHPGCTAESDAPGRTPGEPAGPAVNLKERRVVWQGQVEYQDKMPGNPRNVYTLQCSIFATVVNGEPEICADKWPPKLTLQLMPRSMLMNVVLAVKNASRGVVMSFEPGDGLVKLSRFMGSAWLGLVHFASPPADLKLMLVVYMADKNLFMGMVANDQEGLFAAVKQVIDTHRKQQVTKTKMLQNMSGGTMAPAGSMNITAPVPNATMGMAPAAPGQQYSAAMWPGNNILAKTPEPSRQAQGILQAEFTRGIAPHNQPTTNSHHLQEVVRSRGPKLMPPEQQGPPQQQGGPPGPPQVPPPGLPPGQAAAVSQQQASRLSQLEAERQQNLLKIQQLQQTLELAQAKELQYKQAQQEQQSMLERQRVVTHQGTTAKPDAQPPAHSSTADAPAADATKPAAAVQHSSSVGRRSGHGGDQGRRAPNRRAVVGPVGTTLLS
ncbi:hypothetical protein MTO96_017160 [Rhipicephalus appendiculatus]